MRLEGVERQAPAFSEGELLEHLLPHAERQRGSALRDAWRPAFRRKVAQAAEPSELRQGALVAALEQRVAEPQAAGRSLQERPKSCAWTERREEPAV